VLAQAHAEAERRGLRIAISNPRPDHRQMFEITGLAGVLDLRPSDHEAIASAGCRDVA
jgi:anti-anti-sigma regulatory factor